MSRWLGIAEGKIKVTVADLHRLIRLKEFLREEVQKDQIKVVFHWTDADGSVVEDTPDSDE